MTEKQFRNIKLPALVKRTREKSAGRKRGDIFVVIYRDNEGLLYENEECFDMDDGHNFHNIKIIQQNYHPREIMLELEEVL